MTNLTYPKPNYVKLGLWTIRAKIEYQTNYRANIWCDSENLHLDFNEDLTKEQIDWINALIQREDLQKPDTDLVLVNNTYVMYDIWERKDLIAAECGIDFRIWWDSSGDLGPNVMDKILFTPISKATGATRILTNKDKNALVAALTAGNGWV